ncbi:MAG: DUF4340 domain-containing protein [Deltaproteobacteria bacterium]|nr:DUF4340 domain-containing protein [Deltaproteobacteria bacterium]
MKKNLPILVFSTAILFAIALFMQSPSSHKDLSGSKLLKDAKLDQVKKIIIEKGDEKTTLLRSDDGYSVEEKEGYGADTGKADALLVELLNMKGTEWITSKKEKHGNFGLSDDNKEAIIVTLISSGDDKPGGIIIGNAPKNRGDNQRSYALNSSRYVRAKGKADIFLVSKVTPLQAKPAEWLAKELLQVKGEEIDSIKLKHDSKGGSFELRSRGSKEFEPGDFTVPKGKKLKTYVINGISNALSNLRLTDSMRKENERVKDLSFDNAYVAVLKDGRKYEVLSAQKAMGGQSKHFIKISASFTGAGKEEENTATTPNPHKIAIEDNERLSNWIFEVTGISNFTYKKSDLFEDE